MATSPTVPTMSKEAFHASKEFLTLTDGQKRWLNIFIETQDANFATRKAYGADDESYIAAFTRKLETAPRVLAALDLYYARSPRERFLRDLQNDIQRATGVARIEGRKLYAKALGLIAGAPSEDTEYLACQIGDVVLVDGVKHRVTAIDENGRATDGSPL